VNKKKNGKKVKYIFVTGGVLSSLGKGIAASSIGSLLECSGLKITILKLDPYINIDPGTMNPFQHGEVYVTMMEQKRISISGITRDLLTQKCVVRIMLQRVKFIIT